MLLVDDTIEQLGAQARQPDQVVDVLGGHTDQPRDDHHRQPVGKRSHPFDASAAEIVRPQPVEGVGYEGLNCANPLGCQLRHQHLSMRRMCGVIRGGQNLCGSTERIQLERDDGALGREHHRRGQVR